MLSPRKLAPPRRRFLGGAVAVALLLATVVGCSSAVDPEEVGASLAGAEKAVRSIEQELGPPDNEGFQSVWVATNSLCQPTRKVAFVREFVWQAVPKRYTTAWAAEVINEALGEQILSVDDSFSPLMDGRFGEAVISGSSRLSEDRRNLRIGISSDCLSSKYQLDIRAALNDALEAG